MQPTAKWAMQNKREGEREQMRYQAQGPATRTIVGRDGLDVDLRTCLAKQGLASAHQGTQIGLQRGLSVDSSVLIGFVVHGCTAPTKAPAAHAQSVWVGSTGHRCSALAHNTAVGLHAKICF